MSLFTSAARTALLQHIYWPEVEVDIFFFFESLKSICNVGGLDPILWLAIPSLALLYSLRLAA